MSVPDRSREDNGAQERPHLDPVEPSMAVTIAGVLLPNPLVLASGILGTHSSLLERCAACGAGAVTAKSCGPELRRGHPNPTVLDWGGGLINAVGLPNPGAAAEVAVLRDARQRLRAHGVPLIASLFADTVAHFGDVTRTVCEAEPDLLEVNISCPNVRDEFGTPFAASAHDAAAVTAAVKAVATCPVIIKLAPNVPNLAQIARAVVDAGADAICAINTVPGMVIDAYSRRPILANRSGGVSGPAIKPMALKAVYDISAAVRVPIIGTGGVTTGLDAAEMIMAGATAVGVGSAVYYRGPEAFAKIVSELKDFMSQQGYCDPAQMKGLAHG
jgi:dihydroorotate dehydrogenase (NAD+) catalytic subunit